MGSLFCRKTVYTFSLKLEMRGTSTKLYIQFTSFNMACCYANHIKVHVTCTEQSISITKSPFTAMLNF